MKALITGASGFVGRNLLNSLPKDTIAMVRKMMPGRECVVCDLEHADRLPELVDDVDVICHLAWTGPSGENRNDEKLQPINVSNSIRLAEAAAKVGCKKFIFCGTIAQRWKTLDPYATAKWNAVKAVSDICSREGMQFVHVILPSIYGKGSSGFVSDTFGKMMKGSDITVKSGNGLNDFIHINDVVNGLKMVCEKTTCGEYFIGSGKPRKIRDFIELMANLTNTTSSIDIRDEGQTLTPDDLDISAMASLGYRPSVDFEDWIREEVSLSRSST
jgi:Nucleoside-diphosphate-sugar epimerases